MKAIKSLFDKNLIFIKNVQEKREIFTLIGNLLHERGMVKEEFTKSIIERENNYPTGLDLSPVAKDIPNVAIPHTEPEFCLCKCIVLVKLLKPVLFQNMIAPDKEIDVKYLFFIINNQKGNQTNILSELMGFFTTAENMKKLEQLDNKEEIYQFLTNKNIEIKGVQ
ncbi:PTS sugar transporter subunit IIA [Virgibacillus proomii]|uniref:PTS sugar transporter subunit IIA n=1 Tax=Virgibacillus proomii TaxID=84407 RepID=UPI001C0FECD2|nr:PTS sugar transporter subunit IIA [Virgibacillus proomii]MBU5266852.1 PTS sugar transporter subunit IIA [Virgibacillus proomii]